MGHDIQRAAGPAEERTIYLRAADESKQRLPRKGSRPPSWGPFLSAWEWVRSKATRAGRSPREVVRVELDLDDWKLEDMKALGFRTGVVPIFHAVNSEGRATGPALDGSSWGANVPASMAPPLKKFFTG